MQHFHTNKLAESMPSVCTNSFGSRFRSPKTRHLNQHNLYTSNKHATLPHKLLREKMWCNTRATLSHTQAVFLTGTPPSPADDDHLSQTKVSNYATFSRNCSVPPHSPDVLDCTRNKSWGSDIPNFYSRAPAYKNRHTLRNHSVSFIHSTLPDLTTNTAILFTTFLFHHLFHFPDFTTNTATAILITIPLLHLFHSSKLFNQSSKYCTIRSFATNSAMFPATLL